MVKADNGTDAALGSITDSSPIAIVGLSFRLPGPQGEGLWQALLEGRDLVTSVDPDRWVQDSFLHPNKAEPGTAYTFAAGSIGDIAGFDAGFFGISPREAEQMDPQQRVLLEMAWEAFEHAGIPPSSMRGRRCGVYIGLSSVDYSYRRSDDIAGIDSTTMTGNAGSIAANRISYLYDLRGPSMAIDTACSSSLVAFHQACQAIRCGEVDSALAGGISLHLHPYPFVGFSKASMLSRRGRCHVFDATADGYVRSEGGGIVILKPLDRALADGNRILAVVAGSGVNSDGRKSGLTVPSHEAQAALLEEVYGRAGIAPGDIDYFEAHGTGTAVGDPLETRAIGEALGRHRPAARPLPIGSIKGNVGHLEAAAGMAGLVKALHVLRDRRVPANLHLSTANPNIDFAGLNLSPVREPLDLPADRPLIVGVSAFGFGGTNAHVVLKSAAVAATGASATKAVVTKAAAKPAPDSPVPLLLSARSPMALRAVARAMAAHLRRRTDQSLYDIAYSVARHRDILGHRLQAHAPDREALALLLEKFADSGSARGVTLGKYRPDASAPGFVYCGNGSQWAGMGLQLLDEDPECRKAVLEVDALYRELAGAGSSILDELKAPAAAKRFALTEIAQPALFALQVGITRALARRGVAPVAVCGHSVGEAAAAWASGLLGLEQAVRVIYERSSKQARTRGVGGMTAVSSARAEVDALLQALNLEGRLNVAAINSPRAVTIAGDLEAMGELETALASRQVPFQRLGLDYAFHSSAMDPIEKDLLRALATIETRAPSVPMYSSVTGAILPQQAVGAGYWWRNVREPVDFVAAITAMAQNGITSFVEIGPRPVLTTYLADIGKASASTFWVAPSLKRNDAGAARLGELTAQLELSGALGSPGRLFPVPGREVDLPLYPWQRERHWLSPTAESLGTLARRHAHPLLGYALANEPYHWESHLDVARLPVYADHVVGGVVIFPAAGYVELALAAAHARREAEQTDAGASTVIEDLEIVAPLVLDSERSRTVRLRLDPTQGAFTIVSRDRQDGDAWRTHATGRIVAGSGTRSAAAFELPSRSADLSAERHYGLAHSLGLEYGPAFRTIDEVWYCREGVIGTLTTPPALEPDLAAAHLHPATLDGAFQLLADAALRDREVAAGQKPELRAFLPVRIDRLEVMAGASRAAAARVQFEQRTRRSPRSLRADFWLYDGAGVPLAVVQGARFRAVSLQAEVLTAPRWLSTRAIAMPRRETAKAVALPGVAALAERAALRLHDAARLAARQRFSQEVEPLLDALCGAFAARALRQLVGNQAIDPQGLIDSGRVSAPSAPLLHSLLQILTEDGVLKAIGDQWLWHSEQTALEPEAIWTSLIADYPQYAELTARVGSAGLHLVEELREGPSHEDGAATALDAAAWIDTCTQQEADEVAAAIAAVVQAAVAAQPVAARLRILRVIGAAASDRLEPMPALDPDRCELVVCAAAQGLLDDLRSRWPAAAALDCRVLDVDCGQVDPDALGGRFDLIVLGEGCAGSDEPFRRLANLRRLCCDEGRLLILDQYSSRALDLVHGRAPQWWQAALLHGPAHSRLRAPELWTHVLSQAGFDDVHIVRDTPDAPSGPYLLIARAVGEAAAPAMAPAAPVGRDSLRPWLIVEDALGYGAELGTELAAALQAGGQQVIHLVCGTQFIALGPNRYGLDPRLAAHWDELLTALAETHLAPQGWVHLAGLGLATAASPAPLRAAALKRRTEVLAVGLQACARRSADVECWVVGTSSGAADLPAEALLPSAANDAAPPDRLRDAALLGLTRVAMQEYADRRIRWIELAEPLPCARNAARVAQEILAPDAEDEIIFTAGGRYVPRVGVATPLPPPAAIGAPRVVQLDCPVPGPFRNLRWLARADFGDPAADEIDIDVHAAGLNFRDIMYAMGLLPDEAVEDGFCGATLGMEVSGIVARVGSGVSEFCVGDPVFAFAPASFSNRVRTRVLAASRKPAEWSHAAAATVPTAFFTAYYALHELARLREGERVLIHGAAGGVGIAAIQLAKHWGAEIFATAGNEDKRDLIALLGADHVFDSRSLEFGEQILEATGGVGVDVVLNSLAGEAMALSLRLLRPFGRMLELGKRDFYENSRLGLRPFRNNIAYFGIDADQLLAQRPETAQRVFIDLMTLFAQGILQPLPHRSFDAANITAAFRHMQASRHIGKIVVTFPEGFDPLGVAPVPAAPLPITAHATYLVTGGLTGFGLETARWLVRQGARHLALLSRRGGASLPDGEALLAEFATAGVKVLAPACDVADPKSLSAALAAIDALLPPLRGVVHAAMVIDDGLLRDVSGAALDRVFAPKVLGGLNLHEATRTRALDFFVLYSSATTVFGNPGQGAYVAANLALEALAAERRQVGLPVTCVGWGPIADVGFLARNTQVLSALVERMGGTALSSGAALEALGSLGTSQAGNLSFLDLDWNRLGRFLPRSAAPKFADLARLVPAGEAAHGQESAQELRRRLKTLPRPELLAALTDIVRGEVAEILRMAPERIDATASFADLGMDSLMAVEIATSIEARLDVKFPALALSGSPTIDSVVERIDRLLHPGEEPSAAGEGADSIALQLHAVAAQHADEFSDSVAAAVGQDLATAGASVRSLTRAGRA
jgi:acyl transferase domain-containing protein/NADPH:quinone reductase-like Zn-dependent oxidoreductase/acyl carrier protein/short-subunit dehydrogenase